MIRKPFSILMIPLLLAAPAMAAPPEKLCFLSALGFNVPGSAAIVPAPTVQHEKSFAFEYKNILSQTADMEQDGAAFAVRTEFSLGYSETMLTGRPIVEGIYHGQGGDELFSSGFIV